MAHIRNAYEEDAAIIRRISLDLTISKNSKEQTGFVEFKTPGNDILKKRIKESGFIYVAEHSSLAVGFLAAYPDILLLNPDFSEDEIVQHILEKDKPFIYIDQLAVIREYQGRGIGVRLAEYFINNIIKSDYKDIYCSASHVPYKNESSIRLIQHFDFKQIEEINVYNSLTFGIYSRLAKMNKA